MKRRLRKPSSEEEGARSKVETTSQSQKTAASAELKEHEADPSSTTELEFPPPEYVAELARGEQNPRLLEDYEEAIRILKDEKRFTFREIAKWFYDGFKINADHNAIYRVYTKRMSEREAAEAVHRDDEDERESGV